MAPLQSLGSFPFISPTDGTLFADCSGDGTLAVRAGCRFLTGCEGKADSDEPLALDVADRKIMGSSIYWTARDIGYPALFVKPDSAFTHTEEDLRLRPHAEPHGPALAWSHDRFQLLWLAFDDGNHSCLQS